MKRFAAKRRVDLRLGRSSVAADIALRDWSRAYFEEPANVVLEEPLDVILAPDAPAVDSRLVAALSL